MHRKTIAKNHLSEAAKQGRYGDNVLVHMNKDEAAVLAKAAGVEKLPINPKTGLPEAWVMAALALGSLAVGAYGAWKGGSEQKKQSDSQSSLITQQQQEIEKAESNLEPVKESKTAVARGEFEQALGDLSSTIGQSKEKLTEQFAGVIQKSGMANVAGGKMSTMYKNIQNQFGRNSQNLMGQLGKSMAGIEEWYEGEKSRLQSESKRLGIQKDLANKQSGSWYLGKHIEQSFLF